MSGTAQEKLADTLTGGALTAGVSMNLTDYNTIMEAATLTVGFIAGLFALFFHIRRWYRGRQRDAAAKQNTKE